MTSIQLVSEILNNIGYAPEHFLSVWFSTLARKSAVTAKETPNAVVLPGMVLGVQLQDKFGKCKIHAAILCKDLDIALGLPLGVTQSALSEMCTWDTSKKQSVRTGLYFTLDNLEKYGTFLVYLTVKQDELAIAHKASTFVVNLSKSKDQAPGVDDDDQACVEDSYQQIMLFLQPNLYHDFKDIALGLSWYVRGIDEFSE